MQGKIEVKNVSFFYGKKSILEDINCTLKAESITAITGPSGTGKSTFLSLLNRLWEESNTGEIKGSIQLFLQGKSVDIYHSSQPVAELRRKVGMVFQSPNPLPMSITANVAFPLQLAGESKKQIEEKTKKALLRVHLWDEVKDRLHSDARQLSGGQQQRLCLARALMLEPEILLLDEPTASLDPAACKAIEALLLELKKSTTLVMVSHYQDQIQRIADEVYELREKKLFLIS